MAIAFRIAILLLSLGAILGLHIASIAPTHNWYNQFWWLDWILHFAGGVWVACFFLVFARRPHPVAVIIFAAIVGFVWEVLEYYYNIPFFGVGEASFADSLWILDTLIDLTLDISAATLVAFLSSRYTRDNV